MWGWVKGLAWSLFLSGGGAVLMTYLFQEKLVYVPYLPPNARTEFLAPEDFSLFVYEKIFIETQDKEKLQAWFFSCQRPGAPTWIFLHGNAGNLSFRLPLIQDLIHKLKINVLILSYRGYGLSTGEPSEHGIKLDAEAALRYLLSRKDIDHDKIFAFGRSLGGAVAVHLAASFPKEIKGLIIENSFTSIEDMIDVMFPVLSYFKFLCRNPWLSQDALQTLPKDMPVLFLSGLMDELVPPWMMQALYDSCSSTEKVLHKFPDGDHMGTYLCRDYFEKINGFLKGIQY